MNLTEFLLARIAEDDAAARVEPDGYSTDGEQWHIAACGYRMLEMGEPCCCGVRTRVLAECASKRRVVELHPDMLGWCQGCAHESHPCRTLLALAQPYANHPDFDPASRVA